MQGLKEKSKKDRIYIEKLENSITKKLRGKKFKAIEDAESKNVELTVSEYS